MKHLMNSTTRFLACALALTLLCTLCLTGLSENNNGKNYTIAIGQFAEHPSLDNCRLGFLAGLADAGFVEGENLTVEVQNAQSDMGTAALIASNFAANPYDLICAIATPMAVCCYNSSEDTPVIYTAVSAPVEAGLAGEDGMGDGEITGTSDALPTALQLQLIRAILPEATRIGILYTIGEVNSQVQLAEYKSLAADYGFEIVEQGVTTGADVSMAAAALVPEVDCLNMLTDNTVVQYLQVVLDEADDAGIPVFGSEIEQVVNGCIAAQGIDYFALGKQTGAMAARVLRGEKASEIPFEVIRESQTYVNPTVCEKLHITLSDALADTAIDVTAQ